MKKGEVFGLYEPFSRKPRKIDLLKSKSALCPEGVLGFSCLELDF